MKALQIDVSDNVAVLAQATCKGDKVKIGSLEIIVADAPVGHKIALLSIKKGEMIRKYGAAIGVATQDIMQGEHVHNHNVTDIPEDALWNINS